MSTVLWCSWLFLALSVSWLLLILVTDCFTFASFSSNGCVEICYYNEDLKLLNK